MTSSLTAQQEHGNCDKSRQNTTTPNSDTQCSTWNLFVCPFAIETFVLDGFIECSVFVVFLIRFCLWFNFLKTFGFDSLIVHYHFEWDHLFIKQKKNSSVADVLFLWPLICFQSADTTFLNSILVLICLYCKMYCVFGNQRLMRKLLEALLWLAASPPV